MSYQNILFSLDAGIARVTLNRPDRLNSFNGEMHLELRDALARTLRRTAILSKRSRPLRQQGHGFRHAGLSESETGPEPLSANRQAGQGKLARCLLRSP